MDQHALEYYTSYSQGHPNTCFHRVIALHEEPMIDWEEAVFIVPTLTTGWYELAQFPSRERIEFTRDFWSSRLTYAPEFIQACNNFFNTVDDIGIFLTQRCTGEPFIPELVYSLKNNSGFFHGNLPITPEELDSLKKEFGKTLLPSDFLDFLTIHNGFAKHPDFGIIRSRELLSTAQSLHVFLEAEELLQTSSGHLLNPKSLIPFYKSFNMPAYQCFCTEWYPADEMGNIFYSAITHSISDFEQKEAALTTLAFDTFTNWLLFYLEQID